MLKCGARPGQASLAPDDVDDDQHDEPEETKYSQDEAIQHGSIIRQGPGRQGPGAMIEEQGTEDKSQCDSDDHRRPPAKPRSQPLSGQPPSRSQRPETNSAARMKANAQLMRSMRPRTFSESYMPTPPTHKGHPPRP